MQSFTLDLKTLLQILSRQKQHGLLQAEIPSDKLRIPGTRQLLQAGILLENGVVRNCAIALRQGERVADGQQALQLLLGVGIIEWHWMVNTPQLSLSSPKEASPVTQPIQMAQAAMPSYSPPIPVSIPRRTPRGDEVWQMLPRDYRKILALVDGQRSVQKLATILAMKEDEVANILRTLQSRGLIF